MNTEILKKFHPAFSKTKEARDIKKAIIEAKQKYLGYARLENNKQLIKPTR